MGRPNARPGGATLEEILAHHGIKGMKWGVRRKRGPDGTVSSHPDVSVDAAKAKDYHSRAKTKGTHNLSNQELQHLVNRMNLEQQYSRLTTQHSKSRIKMGQKFLKGGFGTAKTVLSVGNTINDAIKFANSPAGKAMNQAIKDAKAKKK